MLFRSLPLRYTLNYYGCELWDKWKEFEAEKLRPQKLGLKDCPDFLNELIENIDVFLPPTELTSLLSELFELGQQRCNVIILPYRSWNSRRGYQPYWEYLPHFLYDLMNTESPVFLKAVSTWLQSEQLEMFFNGISKILQAQELFGDISRMKSMWNICCAVILIF